MKKLLAFLMLWNCAIIAQVTEVSWVKSLRGPVREKFRDVTVDLFDNKYLVGYSTSDFYSFDGVEHATGADHFIIKLDGSDNEVWHQQFPDVDLMMVKTDSDGNIYLSGFINAPTTFGDTTIYTLDASESFIAKYSPDMEFIWVRRIASLGNTTIKDIAIRNNTILVAGNFGSGNVFIGDGEFANPDNATGMIASLDLDGNVNWVNYAMATISSYDGKANLIIDASGNCIVAAIYSGSIQIGGTVLNSSGTSHCVLLKYNPTGGLVWLKSYGGNNFDFSSKIALDSGGNIILAGRLNTNFTVGSITLSGGQESGYIAKISADGSVAWAKKFSNSSGCYIEGLAVDSDNKIYINSTLVNSQNFGTFSYAVPLYMTQAVVKFNESGIAQWIKPLAIVSNAPGTQMQMSPTDDIYFYAIHRMPSITVGSFTIPNYNIISVGDYDFDAYLAKLMSSTLNSRDFSQKASAIWPIPAENFIHLSEIPDFSPYVIHDSSGRHVMRGTLINSHDVIDVGTLEAGMYFVTVNNEAHKFLKR